MAISGMAVQLPSQLAIRTAMPTLVVGMFVSIQRQF
jgi:hypothetical protein